MYLFAAWIVTAWLVLNVETHVQLTYPPSISPIDYLENIRFSGICGDDVSGIDYSDIWRLPDNYLSVEDAQALGGTPILAGQLLNITWNLHYAPQGGWKVELYNSDLTLLMTWNDSDHWGCATDGTQQTASINIPSDIECEDCILRFVRQALEWGENNLLYSCAIVNITSDIDVCNGCSQNGECEGGKCNCDVGFYGEYCQFENECEENSDCGEHGVCVDTQSDSAPAKQCFCEQGWWGPAVFTSGGTSKRVCNETSSLTLGDPDKWLQEYTGHQSSVPDGNMDIYYKIDVISEEIEFAIKANTRNWVAVGFRPEKEESEGVGSPKVGGEGEFESEVFVVPDVESEGGAQGEGTDGCLKSDIERFDCMILDTNLTDVVFYWKRNGADNVTLAASFPEDGYVFLGIAPSESIPNGYGVIGQPIDGSEPLLTAYDFEFYLSPENISEPTFKDIENGLLETMNGSTILQFNLLLSYNETYEFMVAYNLESGFDFRGVFSANLYEEENGLQFPTLQSEGKAEGEGKSENGGSSCPTDTPILVTYDEGILIEDGPSSNSKRLLSNTHLSAVWTEGSLRLLLQDASSEGEGVDQPTKTESERFDSGSCSAPFVPSLANPMINQDIVVSYARGNAVKVIDSFMPTLSKPLPDHYFGGFDNIIDAIGVERDEGVTLVKFRRKLQTSDQDGDYCLLPDVKYNMIWAYGQLSPSVTHIPESSLEIFKPSELVNGETFYKPDELKFLSGGIGAANYDGRGSFGLVSFFTEGYIESIPVGFEGMEAMEDVRCQQSSLMDTHGFDCMFSPFKGYTMHYTVTGTYKLGAIADGKWVALGFPKTPGKMPGGESVIGNGYQVGTYAMYGYIIQDVLPIQQNRFGINVNSLTTENLDGKILITFEVNSQVTGKRRSLLQTGHSSFLSSYGITDNIQYHGPNRRRGFSMQDIQNELAEQQFSNTVNFQRSKIEEIEDSESPQAEAMQEASFKTTGNERIDDDEQPLSSNQTLAECQLSDLSNSHGFDCMFDAYEGFVMHYTLKADSNGSYKLGGIADGQWVSLGFATNPGQMIGGQAVIGDSNGAFIYELGSYAQEDIVRIDNNNFNIDQESLMIETSENSVLITFQVTPPTNQRRRSLTQVAQNTDFLGAHGQTPEYTYHGSSRRGFSAQNIEEEIVRTVIQVEEPDSTHLEIVPLLENGSVSQLSSSEAILQACIQSTLPNFECMFVVAPEYTLHWSLNQEEQKLYLGAQGKGNWIGFAFPLEPSKMIGADVIIGDTTGIKLYKMTSYAQSGVTVTEDNPYNVILDDAELVELSNGVRLMTFKIDISKPSGRRLAQTVVDYSGNVDLLAAVGPQDTVQIHNYRSGFAVNFASGESEIQKVQLKYYKAHGWLMALGWGFFIPLAIMVARTLKDVDPFWFYFHINANVLGLLCATIAWIIANEKFNSNSDLRHRELGIVVMVFGLFQPLNAYIRPIRGIRIWPLPFAPTVAVDLRDIWEWVHQCIGRAITVCALWNCFSGIQLYGRKAQIDIEKWYVALGSYIGAMCVIYIALESRAERLRKNKLNQRIEDLVKEIKILKGE